MVEQIPDHLDAPVACLCDGIGRSGGTLVEGRAVGFVVCCLCCRRVFCLGASLPAAVDMESVFGSYKESMEPRSSVALPKSMLTCASGSSTHAGVPLRLLGWALALALLDRCSTPTSGPGLDCDLVSALLLGFPEPPQDRLSNAATIRCWLVAAYRRVSAGSCALA